MRNLQVKISVLHSIICLLILFLNRSWANEFGAKLIQNELKSITNQINKGKKIIS